jgi:hypothetical protein
MDITLTTPALLFSTLSLILLAYTNRFLALGSRIRSLHDRYQDSQGRRCWPRSRACACGST